MKQKRAAVVAAVLVVAVVGAISLLLYGHLLNQRLLEAHVPFPVPSHATLRDGGTAVVYICTFCETQLLVASIASLRVIGGWCGRVFIVTQSTAARRNLAAALQEIRQTLTWLPENASPPQSTPEDDAVNVFLVMDRLSARSSTKRVNKAKLSKAHLLALIPERYEQLLYLDVDVLVARGLTSFLAPARQMSPGMGTAPCPPSSDWCMFPDLPCSDCNRQNTGIMVIRRRKSVQACMARWRARISSQSEARDQVAMEHALPVCMADEREGGGGMRFSLLPLSGVRYVGRNFVKDWLQLRYPSREWFIHLLGVKYAKTTFKPILLPYIRERWALNTSDAAIACRQT